MTTTEDFSRLYPDIDPNTGFPLSVMERMALTLSTGIIAFGVVTADIAIATLGLALIIVTALIVTQKTAHRSILSWFLVDPSELCRCWRDHHRNFFCGIALVHAGTQAAMGKF